MTSSIMLLHTELEGQAPRSTKISELEHCNGPSTARSICVYARKMSLISRHGKLPRTTNNRFGVVKLLFRGTGRTVYVISCISGLLRACFVGSAYKQILVSLYSFLCQVFEDIQ
jgi:hypothetical protein